MLVTVRICNAENEFLDCKDYYLNLDIDAEYEDIFKDLFEEYPEDFPKESPGVNVEIIDIKEY